jgi:hypothetical protein
MNDGYIQCVFSNNLSSEFVDEGFFILMQPFYYPNLCLDEYNFVVIRKYHEVCFETTLRKLVHFQTFIQVIIHAIMTEVNFYVCNMITPNSVSQSTFCTTMWHILGIIFLL